MPSFPGTDRFRGTVLHSRNYRSGAAYRGQSVLVVGFGNSGGESAIDGYEQGARPALAMREGNWPEATRALDEGVSLARAIPYPQGEARLLHLMWQLEGAHGDLGLARAYLKTAHAIFERLGARWESARMARLLATDSGSDAASLTAQGAP